MFLCIIQKSFQFNWKRCCDISSIHNNIIFMYSISLISRKLNNRLLPSVINWDTGIMSLQPPAGHEHEVMVIIFVVSDSWGQFLIGLYECSSRKTKGTLAQHDTNQCLLRHSLSHRCSCWETTRGKLYQIIEKNFDYSIAAGHIFPDSAQSETVIF